MLAIRHPPPLPRKNSESGGNSGTFRTSNIGIVGEIVAMPGVALQFILRIRTLYCYVRLALAR